MMDYGAFYATQRQAIEEGLSRLDGMSINTSWIRTKIQDWSLAVLPMLAITGGPAWNTMTGFLSTFDPRQDPGRNDNHRNMFKAIAGGQVPGLGEVVDRFVAEYEQVARQGETPAKLLGSVLMRLHPDTVEVADQLLAEVGDRATDAAPPPV